MYDIIMIIADKIKPQIKKLAEKHGLSLVILFGSQVAGKTHKESDYDFAYLSDKKLSFEDEGKIIIDLAEVIGARDERLINLTDIKKAGAFLLKEIFDRHHVLFTPTGMFMIHTEYLPLKIFLRAGRFLI